MSSVVPPYLADTNVYITAANDVVFRARFETFIQDCGPLLVSALVVSEVLLGITDPTDYKAAVRAVTASAVPRAPTAADWITAGQAIAQLGGETVTKSRSFWNDALLAAQCARLGVTLVTHNTDDFKRLKRFIDVTVAPPFPQT